MKGSAFSVRNLEIILFLVCFAFFAVIPKATATPIPEVDYGNNTTVWSDVAVYSETPVAAAETPEAFSMYGGDFGGDLSVGPDISVGKEGGESAPDGSRISQDCYSQGIYTTYHFYRGGEESVADQLSDSGQALNGRGDGRACMAECNKRYSGKKLCKCLDYCRIAISSPNGCDLLDATCDALQNAGASQSICLAAYQAACP